MDDRQIFEDIGWPETDIEAISFSDGKFSMRVLEFIGGDHRSYAHYQIHNVEMTEVTYLLVCINPFLLGKYTGEEIYLSFGHEGSNLDILCFDGVIHSDVLGRGVQHNWVSGEIAAQSINLMKGSIVTKTLGQKKS